MIGKPQYYYYYYSYHSYYRWTWLVIVALVVVMTTTTTMTTTDATTVLSSPQQEKEEKEEEEEQVPRQRRRRRLEQDQILPIWVTRQELKQQQQHDKDEWRDLRQRQRPLLTTSSTTTTTTTTTPATTTTTTRTPRRFPAEWEPVDRILLARGLGATNSGGGGALLWRPLVEIMTAVTNAETPIWMAAGPDDMTTTTTTTTTNDSEWLFLYSNVPYTPVDSVWIRDYGPISVWEENNNNNNNNDESEVSLVMVDFAYRLGEFRRRDDAMACDWLSGNEWYANVPCETTALVMDGGNLLTDGAGNLFMTDITYDWNAPDWTRDQVDDALKRLLGVQHIHALPYARDPIYRDFPADGTGHIDMFVKLMGPCTVIIAETADPIFRDTMQAAVEYFANLNCRGRQGGSSAGGGRRPGNTSSNNGGRGRGRGRRFSGRGLRQRRPSSGGQEPQEPAERYTIYRVPAWVNYRDASYPYWVTYANSLFIGKNLILVPSYDGGPNDEVQDIYQQAAGPDTTVVMIDSDYVIRLGGAIHCLTMQIPALPASGAPAA